MQRASAPSVQASITEENLSCFFSRSRDIVKGEVLIGAFTPRAAIDFICLSSDTSPWPRAQASLGPDAFRRALMDDAPLGWPLFPWLGNCCVGVLGEAQERIAA